MVFATLEDLSGQSVVVFRAFARRIDLWQADKLVCVAGRPQERRGDEALAESAFEITPGNIEELAESSSVVSVEIESPSSVAKEAGVDALPIESPSSVAGGG